MTEIFTKFHVHVHTSKSHKLFQDCYLNNAWTTLLLCVDNIVEPTILFSIVSPFQKWWSSNVVWRVVFLEQACTKLLTYICLFQLVKKLWQYWWLRLNNVETTLWTQHCPCMPLTAYIPYPRLESSYVIPKMFGVEFR